MNLLFKVELCVTLPIILQTERGTGCARCSEHNGVTVPFRNKRDSEAKRICKQHMMHCYTLYFEHIGGTALLDASYENGYTHRFSDSTIGVCGCHCNGLQRL